MTILAIGEITIANIDDVNISTDQPIDPVPDQLWLDTSTVPNILKRWAWIEDEEGWGWINASPTSPEDIGAETPDGAQEKADDAVAAASTLLQSLADGTYTGGTFIDGTTLYSPNIIGLNILGMTGEFDSLRAGAALGAHVEIGAQDSLPFISMHDDAGNVITALTKQGIMIDPRGKINLPYLVSSNPDNAVIRTVNTVDRRYLMLRSGEGEENGAMIYVYNENDPTYPGQLRLYSGGSISAILRADNSARFYGDLQVDGLISTSAFRTNDFGNLVVEGKFFTYGDAFFDGAAILRNGYIEVRADAGTHARIRAVGGSGRQGICLTGQADTGAGVIYIYGNSDSTNPGQVLIHSGGSSTLRMYNDQSVRFYGDLRYDGGLYQGSTRGIPAADIQSGAVTSAKIASGAVTRVKIANNAVNSTKTSGVTASTMQLREFGTAYTIELTFTNGLLTSYSRYL